HRADAADHGRVRASPVPRLVAAVAVVPAPQVDLGRDRRLLEARLAARPGLRRNRAARLDAADPLRRVRRPDEDHLHEAPRVLEPEGAPPGRDPGAGPGTLLPRAPSARQPPKERKGAPLLPRQRRAEHGGLAVRAV